MLLSSRIQVLTQETAREFLMVVIEQKMRLKKIVKISGAYSWDVGLFQQELPSSLTHIGVRLINDINAS
jgi:hypothetical protein